jgi:hypothetical protein
MLNDPLHGRLRHRHELDRQQRQHAEQWWTTRPPAMGSSKLHADLRRLCRGLAKAGHRPSPARQGTPRQNPRVRSDATQPGNRCPKWSPHRRPRTGYQTNQRHGAFRARIQVWRGWPLRNGCAGWHCLDRDPDCLTGFALPTRRLLSWHARCHLLGTRDRRDHVGGPRDPLLLAPQEAIQSPTIGRIAKTFSRFGWSGRTF